MKAVLKDEGELELREFEDPGFSVEPRDPSLVFSAMEMFAVSMALCTFSVLASYAEQIDADTKDVVVGIRWDYAEDPARIGRIEMAIDWPALPESRRHAAERAAAHCTLHNTLEQPPSVQTRVNA